MSIVFIGQIGSGKTTLYNKTTGSNEKTKSGGDSVTLNVFMKQSCFGQGFSVLDTPGFGSGQDKMEHVAGVISALAEGPISKIVIVTKYNRTNLIIKDVGLNLPAFRNYLHMITVVVTFWDQCEMEEQQQNKLAIITRLNQININSVLFIGKNVSSESLCQQFDQLIATSKVETVNLTPKDIFENFDVSDFDELIIQEMEYIKVDSLREYLTFSEEAKKLIDQPIVPEGQLADYFYAITQYARLKLEENVQKFEKKLKQDLDQYTELKSYEIHNELKTALFKDYKSIIDLACLKTSKGNHFSKYLKKCNYCNQIWLKVAGCTGLTACGRLLEDRQDEQIKYELPPQKFIVSYKNKKLTITRDEKAELSKIKSKEEIEFNLKRNEKNLNSIQVMKVGSETIKIGGIGCKNEIEWSSMIPLTEKELTDAQGILDEKMCNYINEQEKLTEQRTQNQQAQYQKELEKKIQEQKEKMRKAK